MSSHEDNHSSLCYEENLAQMTNVSESNDIDGGVQFSTMRNESSNVGKSSGNAKVTRKRNSKKVNTVKIEPEDETNESESLGKLIIKNESENASNFPENDEDGDEKKTRHHQPLSIQWLNLNRVPNRTNPKKTEDDLSKTIDFIINEHNKKIAEDNKIHHYDEKIDPPIDVKRYEVKRYSCLKARTTYLSETIMTDPEVTQNYACIFFFYKDNPPRIISATSDTAYKVVQPYVDYTFPKKVVTKVGDSDKIKEIERLCLFENCSRDKKALPDKLYLYGTSNLFNLVQSLTCEIKPDSQLHHLLCQIKCDLSCPEEKQPKPSTSSSSSKQLNSGSSHSLAKKRKIDSSLSRLIELKKFHITMKTGSIRIEQNLNITSYPEIIDLFNKYMMDGNMLDNERKESGFEYLYYFHYPDLSGTQLDETLIEEMFWGYKENRPPFVNIIYQKELDDFLYSEKFEISIFPKGKYEELKSNPPEIEEILEKIINKMKKKDDETEFKELMKTAKMKFGKRYTTEYHYEPLLKFFEGELRHPNGKSYFKMRNMWYIINADHLALLQKDFVEICKKSLIHKNSKGWLTEAWKKRPKTLTETELEKRMEEKGITRGECRQIVKSLLECRVRYVDEGTVKQNKLIGKILKKKVISKNKDLIERILGENKKFSEAKIRQQFGKKEANVILTELQKERKVIVETGKEGSKVKYVKNPFPYPLKQILEGKNDVWKEKYDEEAQNILTQHLVELYENMGRNNAEWDYNSTYLKSPYGIDNNYFVFDKICPDNIECCDILMYTEKKVYLYQVKEELGQHTREACSQILNAANEIRSTSLSTLDKDKRNCNNYLKKLWDLAKQRDNNYANQMASFDEKKFLEIFRRRKLVFVYAYCPKESHEFPNGVRSALKAVKKDAKNRLVEMLINLKYLNSYEDLTYHFITTKKEDFILEGEFQKHRATVFNQLRNFYDASKSNIAKMEIVRVAREVKAMGYEFKICKINKK